MGLLSKAKAPKQPCGRMVLGVGYRRDSVFAQSAEHIFKNAGQSLGGKSLTLVRRCQGDA
jgi:hypothetical protein